MHDLMADRYELAQQMGRRSFAHHTIGSHTLAGSPEAVTAFLDDFAGALKSQVSLEALVFKAHNLMMPYAWSTIR